MRMYRRVRKQRFPSHVWHLNSGSSHVMLATAIGYVKDVEGKLIECRIMLDSGSQSSLVTEEIFMVSKQVKKNSRKYLLGLGDEESVKVKGEVVLELVFQNGNSIKIGALILDKVSSLIPTEEIDVSNFTRRTEIGLSDENFHIPAKIDVLLGADVYYDMVLPKAVERVQGFCIMETILGKHAVGEIGKKVEITKNDVPPVIKKNSVEVYTKTRNRIHVGVAVVAEKKSPDEDPKCLEDYLRDKYPYIFTRSDATEIVVEQGEFPKFFITDEDHEPYEDFPNQFISCVELEIEPGEQNRGVENKETQEIFNEEGSQINLNQTEFVISSQSESESVDEDKKESEHTLGVQNKKEEHKITTECCEWEEQFEKLLCMKLKALEEEFRNFNPYNTKKAQDSVKAKLKDYVRNRHLGNVGTSNSDVGKQESERVVNMFIGKVRDKLNLDSSSEICVKTDFIPDCQHVPAIISHVDLIPDCQKVPAMISKTKKGLQ
jgi:hypothetical protein